MADQPTLPTPAEFSPARRVILALGATGLVAGIAGYVGLKGTGTSQSPANAAGASPKSAGPTVIDTSAPAVVTEATRDFHAHLNTEFVVTSPDSGESRCKLIAVSPEVRQDTFKGSFVSFTLLFKASGRFLPEGGICRVSHENMKEMEIFLSPVGRTDKETTLEAVFYERA